MEREVQLSSAYADDVSAAESKEEGATRILALKVDAVTTVPPLSFMAVFSALREDCEMHNTGLSFENVRGELLR